MKIKAIAAIGNQRQLGMLGRIPWHNPEDLKMFHETVKGKPIVCGRKTYEGLPAFLKEEVEIAVVSKEKQKDPTFKSVEEAILYFKDKEEVWICGGAGIYKHCIENWMLDELWLSHIDYNGYADVYFPEYYQLERRGASEVIEYETFVLEKIKVEHKARNKASGISYEDSNVSASATDIQSAINELGSYLNWREPDPIDDPQEGDTYFDSDRETVVSFQGGEWRTIAEQERRPEHERSLSADLVMHQVSHMIRQELSPYIGEINDRNTRRDMARHIQNTVASLADRNINVRVDTDFTQDDSVINCNIYMTLPGEARSHRFLVDLNLS